MNAGRCPQVAEMESRLAEIKRHSARRGGTSIVKHLMTEAEMLTRTVRNGSSLMVSLKRQLLLEFLNLDTQLSSQE